MSLYVIKTDCLIAIGRNKIIPKTNSSLNLRMSIYTAAFTALIIVGSYVSIPLIGGVPITLADFFVVVSAIFLGMKHGLIAVSIYVLLGAIGLPVYSGGASGLAILFGPTGGYIFGYIVAAFAIGLISESGKYHPLRNALAIVVGIIFLFAFGLLWLKVKLSLSIPQTIAAGLTPFILPQSIKMTASFILSITLARTFKAKIEKMKEQYAVVEEAKDNANAAEK